MNTPVNQASLKGDDWMKDPETRKAFENYLERLVEDYKLTENTPDEDQRSTQEEFNLRFD